MESKETKDLIPDWIKDLQENSWNLELIISGGAIFSLFQLGDVFIDYMMRLKMTSQIPGSSLFLILGTLALKLLTIGFLFHLLLRTFWLGQLCVNYVFPNGVTEKKSNYKFPFKEKYKKGDDLRGQINGIDRASGLVMYMSVLSTLVLVGFMLLVVFMLSIPRVLNLPDWYFGFSVWLILIYHFDLFLFGLLRKIPVLSYVTFPVFWLFDRVSLRVFYEKSLRMFSSNISKWKVFLGMIFSIFFAMLLTYSAVYKVMHWPYLLDARTHRMSMANEDNWMNQSHYMEEVEKHGKKFYGPAIQSEIISDAYLEIFVPYNVIYDDYTKEDEYLSDNFKIYIDDSLYKDVVWMNSWAYDNDQIGIRTFINIQHLTATMHKVTVDYPNDDHDLWLSATIPFWLEK
ncbi:hypothetical protein K6119_16985 [Paracrocinitomix mangrovi]|uniref:hypothetical protein n=1 Tax=Paracrocinitomix mangrovi TaxID=2862509 RepID=UPI001C8DDF99|nr:hypothetical protein [Paracrocinitomix mangrovi]UKN01422.1 hypothetical protein K6119_16985 [Paracrocinitomix mangrovi]